MKVAVLTLTRDRLAYTKHCFARLVELAGCEFDHFILDQASTDGTWGWIAGYGGQLHVRENRNVGIWRGFNRLIELAGADYDVYVTFDNDCELVTDGAMRDVCAAALDYDMALSPRILGLQQPPPTIRQFGDILETSAVGNIFMAIPAWVIQERRFADGSGPFDERCPIWGGDELTFAEWMRTHGAGVGYVNSHEANHYLTTEGQLADVPWYFERKREEGCPC